MTNPTAPLQIDYAELERFAAEHDLNADQVLKWAARDQGFGEEYLRTHGKVNYATYLKIQEFLDSKLAAGTAYAQRQSQTAASLRTTVETLSGIDESSAAEVITGAAQQ